LKRKKTNQWRSAISASGAALYISGVMLYQPAAQLHISEKRDPQPPVKVSTMQIVNV
jgi:hypothetical protein